MFILLRGCLQSDGLISHAVDEGYNSSPAWSRLAITCPLDYSHQSAYEGLSYCNLMLYLSHPPSDSAIPSTSSTSFYWRIVLENRRWTAGMLIAAGLTLHLVSLIRSNRTSIYA